jgi:hypothetical protein
VPKSSFLLVWINFFRHHSVPLILASSIRRRLGLHRRCLHRLGLRRRRLCRSTDLTIEQTSSSASPSSSSSPRRVTRICCRILIHGLTWISVSGWRIVQSTSSESQTPSNMDSKPIATPNVKSGHRKTKSKLNPNPKATRYQK